MRNKFPFFPQHDAMDCGPACLRMVAQYYGRHYTLESLRQKCHISREGVSLLGISGAAEGIGFKTVGVHISFKQLKEDSPLPCIVHWKQRHFVVVYKIRKDHVYVADPAHGLVKFRTKEFLNGWISRKGEDGDEGIALLLEPQPEFYAAEGEKPDILILRSGKTTKYFSSSEVAYIVCDCAICDLYYIDGTKFTCMKSLAYFESLLPNSLFCRINHNIIVNLNQISEIISTKGRKHDVRMKNGSVLTVSYRKWTCLKEKMCGK